MVLGFPLPTCPLVFPPRQMTPLTLPTSHLILYAPCRGILLDPHDSGTIWLVPPAKAHTRGYPCQPFPTSTNHMGHASLSAAILELLPEQTSTAYKPARSHCRCPHPKSHNCEGIRISLLLDRHVVSKVSAKANNTDDRCLTSAKRSTVSVFLCQPTQGNSTSGQDKTPS